ncbi:MAG: RnfABCDGE type electron transport complex subunit D [Clostridiales bacterium]|nr:RnfABCDGE type electron transport complex subunit D [Clostridiales bacterium]
MDNKIVISTPPHVKSRRTTKGIMLDVLIALLPAAVMGIVYFRLNAFILEITAVLAAVATEFVYFFIKNKGFSRQAGEVCKKWWKQFDYTSIVTGLILALILPSTVKWYEVLIGAIFAIAIVKMVFGGTGKNLVNPAATGRIFMFLSFSLTVYTACAIKPVSADSAIFTGPTHLSGWLLATEGAAGQMSWLDLFLGTGVAGCIGETCKAALILGYIYLVVRKVIKWWQPLLYIVVASFLSVCFAAIGSKNFEIGLFLDYMLSGGLMFGAIFMATDYVTSPKGIYGQIVYYAALGVLTALLRYLTKIEVVSFVIMLMNLLVPLIDTYIVRKPFGYKKVKKQKEGK